jgi:hypothetical protein
MFPAVYEQLSDCLDNEAVFEARLWSCRRHIAVLEKHRDIALRECRSLSRKTGRDNEKRHAAAIEDYNGLRAQISILQDYANITYRELTKVKEITRTTIKHLSKRGA